MNKEFDLLIFIGRFQPFHLEHKRVVELALKKARFVLVLIGSAGKARTIRNPFTFDERHRMISESFSGDDASRLIIKPIYDKIYNDDAWIKQVQTVVNTVALDVINSDGFHTAGIVDGNIGLIGMAKDHTSYYLKMFPQFASVDVPPEHVMHATEIREAFLNDALPIGISEQVLPASVIKFLDIFSDTAEFIALQDELHFVRKYKKQWDISPYPPTFVTTDALVVCSGHILLITRKAEPGKGLLALPGGFLNQNEKIVAGTIRELKEETKIKVPEAVLRGSIARTDVFDDPNRSSRGRTITHCSLIQLPNATKLPKVKGSDDALTAGWYKLSELDASMFFEDHWDIIEYQIGL